MAVDVALGTPLAEALSNVVQPKLVEVGWSSEGQDDSALAEYIILMLVNGKTQDQIAAELSTDLLGLGPDDTGAIDFSRWLFDQVAALTTQVTGGAVQAAPSAPSSASQSAPTVPEQGSQEGDAEMNDASGPATDSPVPTGPKAMRAGRPGAGGRGRIMGQINKAMDRSNESILHRVRPASGTERVNSHAPPRGPRNSQNRNINIRGTASKGVGGLGMHGNGMTNNGPSGPMMQMTPQQQMQMMAMFEEQARMMAQFMPGMVQPAINPAFQHGNPNSQGRSLFDRVEGPSRQNGGHNRRQQNGLTSRQNQSSDSGTQAESKAEEQSSSMEVESSQHANNDASTTVCRFNLRCTKKDCAFAHQSPAAPEGTPIDITDECSYGAACKNKKCAARHPSPAQKVSHQAEEQCRYYPNCTNPHCPFKHPTMPLCRNGADCSTPGCAFTHIQTPCKYNPCLNRSCPFKHAEGQKGAFSDKVWKADGTESNRTEHVSERKFVDDDGKEEELIKPEATAGVESLGTELVT